MLYTNMLPKSILNFREAGKPRDEHKPVGIIRVTVWQEVSDSFCHFFI